MSTVPIGSCRVGEGQAVFIVAEVASAHQGEPGEAVALAHAAAGAGASAVKFQLFRAADLIAPNDPRMETFGKIELTGDDWERILDEAGGLGLPVLADVFDRASLWLGERHGVSAYKIHSTDMENPDFIRTVAATGKTVMLSTGGCLWEDVETAVEIVRREGNEHIILLYGIQNFPTRVEDSHLRHVRTLKSRFGLPVGFLDHVDGGAPTARILPALAFAFGADLIEKHITLNRAARGFDYQSALDPGPFGEMVAWIREAEKAAGRDILPKMPGAEEYHRMMRRAILSGEVLPQGEPVRAEQLVFLRNERGLAPKDAGRLIGKRPRRDIRAWEPLTEALFE